MIFKHSIHFLVKLNIQYKNIMHSRIVFLNPCHFLTKTNKQ
jgi:hypothetical protein